jgi:superfamily II DNA helicase RecQ
VEPTGGGKTALMVLPAALEGARTTIVVTPLVSLRDHLLQECTRMGIACEVWSNVGLPTGRYLHAKKIVVAAEHLHNARFYGLVEVLRGTQQLDRVVIDEAHFPLIAGHWRETLKHYDVLVVI